MVVGRAILIEKRLELALCSWPRSIKKGAYSCWLVSSTATRDKNNTTPCFFVVCVVNFCSLHATQTAAKKEHNQQLDDRWTIIKTTPKMPINLFGKKVVGHFGRYSDKWHIILSAKKNPTVYSKDVIPNFKNKSLNWNKLCIYAQIYKFGYTFDTLRRK